jgi:hypothetical protein
MRYSKCFQITWIEVGEHIRSPSKWNDFRFWLGVMFTGLIPRGVSFRFTDLSVMGCLPAVGALRSALVGRLTIMI